jgi:hypothetical protein
VKLRQELGETIALAQTDVTRSEILLERARAAEAERSARDAQVRFRRAGVWGGEAEAAVAISRALLARGDAAGAAAALDAAAKPLRDSKDARLQLRRDLTLAEIRQKQGRADEAGSLLDAALSSARRQGFTGLAFEIEWAMAQAGRLAAPELAREARSAGYLLVARKAR